LMIIGATERSGRSHAYAHDGSAQALIMQHDEITKSMYVTEMTIQSEK
jgi:hypothetical protein